ncbi:SusC/RagA family TonB-linked outer membrane protein [Arsenicibacter rosenii]|uniref:SusC/RagA family TonB-linked outer membrane protein n=1 Tax=Arsenicibacter rosenii TaxID=1750698 RepID=A0A1S2VJQ6_9BACT|nr:SusC/RagA family TonB-linked outer membrane protein [Arsenicibacter rosenii]OIN58992.1 SusC/RagA family TonB-linked outer membrane protein [Arsenicibacter rosenii]
MRKFLLVSLLFVCCLWVPSWAQDRKISGKVLSSEDGSPMPGVSVVLKGTTKGTNTDAQGAYTLMVPAGGGKLIFSFVGSATQEVEIGNRSTLDVKLENDSKQLSEVVVTAVGIQRDKKALAYAVTNLKGGDLQQRSEPDPLRALSGKVPGVNITAGNGAPGAGTRITIRGNNSFTGNNQPLFVVDGIPFDNSVNATQGYNQNTVATNRAYDIDPNNIETMTVLKGAAASALYGSRAANGVIVITTKSGSKSARKGLEVSYNSSYSVEKISSLPDYQDTYTQGSNQTYNGGFIGNWGTVFPAEVDRINAQLGFERYSKVIDPDFPAGTIPHPLVDQTVSYGYARYPSAFPELVQSNGRGIAVPLVPHDIIGGFFRTGKVMENGIQINSTGDKTSLNASVSRTKNDGIIPNSFTERTTLSFGGNATLSNKLNVAGSVAYTNTNQQSPQSGAGYYADYGGLASAGSIYSRLFYLPRNYDLMGYPFENPVDGSNVFYRALDNPLWTAKYNLYNSTVNRIYGNMTLNYDVTPWLNLTARGGINTYSETRKNVVRPGGTFVPLGQVIRQDLTRTEVDFTFLATAQHDFSEKISTKLLVGFNPNQRSYTESAVSGAPVIDPNVLTIGGTLNQTSGDYKSMRRLYGLFSEFTFGYNNIAFLTASVRNDHSSTLPKANNSYFYPAISGSFVFTDAFNLPKNILNFGKLRANYAKVGKDADPYQVFTAYNLNRTFYNGTAISTASLPSQLNNAVLKPEFTAEVELGAELQFFNNRIGLDIAHFDRVSTDLIVTRELPRTTGFATEVTNAGKISNKGWEVGLTLIPVKTASGFTWTSFGAFTRIRSRVEDAGPGGEIFIGGTGLTSLGTIFRNGMPYGQIIGSVNARDDQGNLLINPTTGLPIRAAKSAIIGDPNTKYTIGWTNTFTYKNFNLNVLIDYKAGGSLFSSTAASLLLRGQLKTTEDREGMRVIPGVLGDPATYKPLVGDDGKPIKNTIAMSAFQYHFTDGYGAYGADEVNIYDASVIRLREVSLAYSVPKAFLRKYAKVLGSLSLSLSGRNLWFKAPNMLKGLNFDPEVLSNLSDSNIQGFDLGVAPSTRRFGINLNASF